MSTSSESVKADIETEEKDKKALLARAAIVAVMVFFFAVILFIGIVILVARFATKAGAGN